ncbi:MAG: STAS domain-containing protein, partial [Solirubrobacterales bacterium]|nr:STAS domain-containing protein [Solirubrobacterales bacterium]
MIIQVGSDPAGVTVGLSGELDLATAPQLERVLDELAARDTDRIILDLRDLSFSDAAGLRAIERGGRRLGPRLTVCGPRPPVQRLIQVTQLDELVNVNDGEPPENSDTPASNAAYVCQLWEAYNRGGPEQFAALVPDDVMWTSAWSGGK